MRDIRSILEDLKNKLLSSKKEKILCISTTADLNNPAFILGTIKETRTTIAGNIILCEGSFVDQIVESFDGVVDYFMVDCEVKNELKNLESLVFARVKKSKIFVYKPNDFTADSLDMLVAVLFKSLIGKKVLIIGAGNIGSKIALKLCERGAEVFLQDKNTEKVNNIMTGLNLIKRSGSTIHSANNSEGLCDLVLACTPGIPVVSKDIIEKIVEGGKVIDVGNRTILPEALLFAQERNVEVLSLSSLGGYTGMIENWLFQRDFLKKTKQRSFGNWSVIVPGVLGGKGDILVDDIDLPQKVFGVCDGVGGLLPEEEGKRVLQNYLADNKEKGNINNINNLYQ